MAWYLSQNHAWFSSFAPAHSPEIVVTVLVEHGGSGPEVAVPVAMQIIHEYERLQAVRSGTSAVGRSRRRSREVGAAAMTFRLDDGGGLLGRVREHFDWTLFITVAALAVIGVINLYSATSVAHERALRGLHPADLLARGRRHPRDDGRGHRLPALRAPRLRALRAWASSSCVLVFILGREIRGSSRWIYIGSYSFQPSEFMKLFLVIALAKYLHDDPRSEGRTLKDLVGPGAHHRRPDGARASCSRTSARRSSSCSSSSSICALTRVQTRTPRRAWASAGRILAHRLLGIRPARLPERAHQRVAEPEREHPRLQLGPAPGAHRRGQRRAGSARAS